MREPRKRENHQDCGLSRTRNCTLYLPLFFASNSIYEWSSCNFAYFLKKTEISLTKSKPHGKIPCGFGKSYRGEGSQIERLFPHGGVLLLGALLLVLQSAGNEGLEQRVCAVGAALEFGVELHADVEVAG